MLFRQRVTFWVITNVTIITFLLNFFLTQTRRSMAQVTYTVLDMKYRIYNRKNMVSYL